MAHHHHATNHPSNGGEKEGDSKIHSTIAPTPNLNHSPREVEKRKNIFDYQIAGFSWPFVLIMSLMTIAVLGMILKAVGVF